MTTGSWGPDDIARLVSRLTLEQKVAQLGGLIAPEIFGRPEEATPHLPTIDTAKLKQLRPHGVGHLSLAWFIPGDADTLRTELAKIQDGVRELSPFGIGALVHNEGINGFLHATGSQFPTAWAQATTWDPELVGRAASVTSAHMRDAGFQLMLSPVMDINRDPRWGRVHETYGEDPELAAQMSVAFVRAVQKGGDVLATGKHFLGYGNSEGALNQAITQFGRRALVDEYAEPFRRAIAEAGLATLMNSYNEIDGVPAAANRWLLTDFLRDTLGFDGLTVADYDSVNMLRTVQRTARTEGEAAVQALSAGLDVELPSNPCYSHLADEVTSGRLDEKVIDVAVTRVLVAKARVGLIPGFTPSHAAGECVRPDLEEGAVVRRALASRSTVLLQNDGVLPLAPGQRRIVVVGPAADELRIHFGAYTSVSNAEMPIGLAAVVAGEVPGIDPATFNFTDIFQTRLPGMDPTFEAATRDLHPEAPTVLGALRALDAKVDFVPLGSFERDAENPLSAEAVERAVADADVVVAVLGERTGWAGNNTAGEGQSSVSPSLPGDQEDLLDHLANTGKQIVSVIVSGRPLLLEKAARASHAILLAPLLGEEAGTAIAQTLFGQVNPSGKLPSTFPRHLGQIPLYHGHHHGSGYEHPTGTRHGYGDLDTQGPLYAFGHGLSYTDFAVALDERDGSPAVELAEGVVRARLTVTNTGSVSGETVAQLYARDEFASVVRPVRQLIAFQRVALNAGERKDLVLEAPIERLHYTLTDGSRGIEPGDVTVLAGLASDALPCAATVTVA
ncbi:glycoside hydrolase family 3 N-terminal domain-containing protein [Streptomyces acidiscabies]|uniref:Glycoside hydrolase n=1 Tax=Streptomyces acidiscabies TaxID=42234 RepID=A0A0L0KQ26_9ACTN|nr:glycoside hydrolase family 3 N-terminal domain-containing protein [Streptomyces acidiscabies]KND39649.1 glycoside hydrolase [Streptomyces acidiscabies]